ncbi:MAG: preprotein translocase subunit SecE [Anaerovorax sp.]
MEKEKSKKPAPVAPKKQKGSIKGYFKGVKTETKKVIWPTRKELVSYTGVVILACAAFGLAIWAIDSAFLAALGAVLGITF